MFDKWYGSANGLKDGDPASVYLEILEFMHMYEVNVGGNNKAFESLMMGFTDDDMAFRFLVYAGEFEMWRAFEKFATVIRSSKKKWDDEWAKRLTAEAVKKLTYPPNGHRCPYCYNCCY